MKKIFLNNGFRRLTAILFAISLLTACNKDKEQGPPSITRVRANLPSPNDSTLTKTGPGTWVVIEGVNLSSATSILFNGYPATFNSGLFASGSLVVLIPGDMPFASLDQAQLNTVKVVTPGGEAIYTLAIEPPPPVISSMTNEMAVAGESVIIYGFNFFYISKVVFPGNIEVTSGITANASGTELTLTIPSGISTGGTVKVVNRYGTGTSVFLFNDATTGVLCNFDGINTLNNWAGIEISNSSANYPGNRGNYARFNLASVSSGDWGWWNGGRSINCETAVSPWVPSSSLSDPAAKWAVKFEINTKTPWTATGTMILDGNYSWNYVGAFEPWATATDSKYSSGGWKTIVFPLSKFKTSNGTGTAAATPGAFLNGANRGFNIFLINQGTAALTNFDVAVDNFRVVRISN